MKNIISIWIVLSLVIFVMGFQFFYLNDTIKENKANIETTTEISGTIISVLGDLVNTLKGESE